MDSVGEWSTVSEKAEHTGLTVPLAVTVACSAVPGRLPQHRRTGGRPPLTLIRVRHIEAGRATRGAW